MIETNKLVVIDSTSAIEKNKIVIEQSTGAIEKNAQALNDINAAMDKLKSNKAEFGLIIALIIALILVPPLVAIIVWWQTRKLVRLWSRERGMKDLK